MTWAHYLSAYLAIGYLMLLRLALRNRFAELLPAVLVALLWPLIPVVLLAGILWAPVHRSGWLFDVEFRRDLAAFGFRRPEGTPGWAVRFLWVEFQVWRKRGMP